MIPVRIVSPIASALRLPQSLRLCSSLPDRLFSPITIGTRHQRIIFVVLDALAVAAASAH